MSYIDKDIHSTESYIDKDIHSTEPLPGFGKHTVTQGTGPHSHHVVPESHSRNGMGLLRKVEAVGRQIAAIRDSVGLGW